MAEGWSREVCAECPLLENLKESVELLVAKVHIMEGEFSSLMNDLGKAAHDMHEPLRTIRFHVDDLLLDVVENEDTITLPKDDLKLIRVIKEKAAFLSEMIEDVTDIFKMSDIRGSREDVEEFDLKDAILEAKDNLSATLSKVNGTVSLSGKFPRITSRRIKWIRVFQNLISNSVRYNRSKKPRAKIWFSDNSIHIEDNGIGIPEDKKDKIFKLFVRLPDREDMAEGTGAGLYMVEHFLTLEGCSITVESDGKSGSLFIIDITSLL